MSCGFEWGGGKTFRIVQEFHRADGVLAAQVSAVGGLMDLAARRLVPDPGARLRALATTPELFDI